MATAAAAGPAVSCVLPSITPGASVPPGITTNWPPDIAIMQNSAPVDPGIPHGISLIWPPHIAINYTTNAITAGTTTAGAADAAVSWCVLSSITPRESNVTPSRPAPTPTAPLTLP
ncbi:hypothetical protein THAOC_16994 [Thalassiosira oceanica]|uniref:Uncharacterized protein n=1 Tax=Thalassiosira oceanica TaxID=159749 RepID=K0SAT0_THAOC|nr:hypothetical protein THAOC_16994 [Thalassiosira oceanica]|eukprot:EJK62395.1 hypothetical protein THAOC_16994 [Thalassiosira oceanica]